MFHLSANERLTRARVDLRCGLPVVLGNRLIAATETLSPDRLSQIRQIGTELSLVITHWRAKTLKLAAYDGSLTRIQVRDDHGLDWIRAVGDPALDLAHPMKGPFIQHRGEIDAGLKQGLILLKSAFLLPAFLYAQLPDGRGFAGENGLSYLDDATIADHQEPRLLPVIQARVPMEASRAGRVHVFRPEAGGEEHYAIEIGDPDREKPVLARLHSACFTGDVLGSVKCDCGAQLHAALNQMGKEGQGVLLYLQQEGRGIGLANKMRAYGLQDQGFDTVEANHRLGFEDDERDFRIGAGLLSSLGFSSVRLLTNNPAKVQILRDCGMQVTQRVPLKVGQRPENADYLATKARKSGHIL